MKIFLLLILLLGCVDNSWKQDYSGMPSLYRDYVKGSCFGDLCQWNRHLTDEELEWLTNRSYGEERAYREY